MTTKEHPMLFNGPMVRAILEGRKTQTRRLMKPQPECYDTARDLWHWRHSTGLIGCASGDNPSIYSPMLPGERIWVRETWCSPSKYIVGYQADAECGAWMGDGAGGCIWVHHGLILESPAYRSRFDNDRRWRTFGLECYGGKWRPSIHMPRWAARIFLTVTNVRVERIQDISEEDLRAEIDWSLVSIPDGSDPWGVFAELWQSTYPNSWTRNDWVFVYSFERTEA